MDIIRVGSFNTQDNKINRDGGMRLDGTSNALRFYNMLVHHDFDFLGTQELTINYIHAIQKYLRYYKLYGSYRYGNGILTKIPWNETNSIITNKKVIETKTYGLPKARKRSEVMMMFKGHIMPRRIATVIVSEHENAGTLCVINTHLDYETPSLQIRQLEEISLKI